ncbi:MAG: phage protein Gp37 [Pyrinomonadaceae bacterium]
MSIERRGFSFKVGGIEDGMVAALKEYCASYRPDVATYGGELDTKNLREALDSLSARFPLYLVSYGDGEDKLLSPLGPEIGAPREYLHGCSFSVICCDDNARGEAERRRGATGHVGVWQMIEDAQTALTRMQFVAVIRREGEADETVVLNTEPLNPAGIEHITQLPELTAYAVHFDTAFVYSTPDRRQPGAAVQEIEIEIFPSDHGSNSSRPGVLLGEQS